MDQRFRQLSEWAAESPQDPFLQYSLAMEYEKHFPEKAWALYQKVLKTFPEYLPAYYMAGKCLEKREEFAEAVKVYQKGIHLAEVQNELKTLRELKAALDLAKAELED
jgi:tetratricopeptide (TPR) repeat protein